MTDLQFSPDLVRQGDLADLGINADVRTSFGGTRRAVVELGTEDLDHLLMIDGVDQYAHASCISESDYETAVDEAKEIGRQEGYDEALADIAALAESGSA